jgi:hypothetical protein
MPDGHTTAHWHEESRGSRSSANTGKAMAGLIAMIREGRFSDEHNVVFLHTGGWTALFAYEEELAEEEASR